MDSDSAASGPSARADLRTERTRAALRMALLRNLHETPFDQVTVRKITRQAEVSYATFFRHYADKEALLEALAAEEIAEVVKQALPILFGDAPEAAALAVCEHVAAQRQLWSALLSGGAAATVRVELIRQARKIAASRPPRSGGTPRDLRVINGAGGTLDAVAWWLQQDEPYPPARMAEILHELVFAPMLAEGFGD